MSSNVTSPSQSDPGREPGQVSATGATHPGYLRRWRENPERAAWAVLISSFTLFMLLLIFVPLTIRYGIRYMTVAETATLDYIASVCVQFDIGRPCDL